MRNAWIWAGAMLASVGAGAWILSVAVSPLLRGCRWSFRRLMGLHLGDPWPDAKGGIREAISLLTTVIAATAALLAAVKDGSVSNRVLGAYVIGVGLPIGGLYLMTHAKVTRGFLRSPYFDAPTLRFARWMMFLTLAMVTAVFALAQTSRLPDVLYHWRFDETAGLKVQVPIDEMLRQHGETNPLLEVELDKRLSENWNIYRIDVVRVADNGTEQTLEKFQAYEQAEKVKEFAPAVELKPGPRYLLMIYLHANGTLEPPMLKADQEWLAEQKKPPVTVRLVDED